MGLRNWALERPGASGLLILVAIAAGIVAVAALIVSTSRSTTTTGEVTAVHVIESDQGSYPYAYISSAAGAFGTSLPRGSDCRPGSRVSVIVTRDLLGTHQSVSLLSSCVTGPQP